MFLQGTLPELPASPQPHPESCGLSGAGPKGGVQHSSQQGVPLPDKNRFFSARAAQIIFSDCLSFSVNLVPDQTIETFYFALSGADSHLYDGCLHCYFQFLFVVNDGLYFATVVLWSPFA